ncbi:uncharacterized protein LOC142978041 isoform X2 [Anticarsia gemmatalis]
MCCCGSCAGHILVVTERLVSICAVTSVVVCIMLTLAVTMGVGVGLGYNYCFVDLKVNGGTTPSLPDSLRRGDERDEPREVIITEGSYRRSPATVVPVTPSTDSTLRKYTLTLALHGNVDFPALLSKLRARNKNVTLELVT